MKAIYRITIGAVGLTLAGCAADVSTSPPSPGLVPGDGAAIVTDASSYTLESDPTGWSATIPFEFTNRSDRRISLLNCGGAYGIRLDRQEGDDWVTVWRPVLPMCLSQAIRLEPGEVRSDTLRFFAGRPGSNTYPQLDAGPVEGTYRLVIEAAFWDYDHDGPPWGEAPPLEFRVSNPFELVGG